MIGIAICPHCDAIFNIEQAQLETTLGLVRCGRCMQTFDVREYFLPDRRAQPRDGLPMNGDLDFTEARTVDDLSSEPLQHVLDLPEFVSLKEEYERADDDAHYFNDDLDTKPEINPDDIDQHIKTLQPAGGNGLQHSPANSLDNTPDEMQPGPAFEYEYVSKPHLNWLWIDGAGLLFLALCIQAVYFFRVAIAANFPTTKPALLSACEMLDCEVPLPQNAKLMSIESSNLASTTTQNHLVFEALLHNQATYAQAYPILELTFTDTLDNPLARRNFKPADYLSATENEATGMLPDQEAEIKLHINAINIKPSGYRLVLLY